MVARGSHRITRGGTRPSPTRRKRPLSRQHRLKAASRPARTEVVATELLFQLLVAVDDAPSSLDVRLAGEAPASLAHHLKSGRTPRTSRPCVA